MLTYPKVLIFISSSTPYRVYASGEGSDESAEFRRLAWAFGAQQCDQNQVVSHLLAYWTFASRFLLIS